MTPPLWKPRSCLLDRLPPDLCTQLAPDLQLVDLPVGRILQETWPDGDAGAGPTYFFRSGLVSILYGTSTGDSGELVSLGNEGMLGLGLLIGRAAVSTRAVVQAPGEAFVLRPEVMEREFRRKGPFQSMILRHTQWVMSQMAQTAICIRHHSIEKQLCRWLLMAFERLGWPQALRITHEGLGHLLGVRREGVTEAAGRLQEAGAISYSRGSIRLESREALQQRACECYSLLRRDYHSLCAPHPFT